MPVGKLAAQVAHASMSFMSRGLMRPFRYASDDPNNEITHELRQLIVDPELASWLDNSFTKVVVAAKDEAHLLALYDLAGKMDLRRSLICDEGRTVFNGVPTNTCVAVGPNYIERVDAVTKGLPLYR